MQWLVLLTDNPVLRLFQLALIVLAIIAVFLVFYVLRDVLLRSRSFVFQLSAVIVTALLPGVGFLLYLLVRPPVTLRERETEDLVRTIANRLGIERGSARKKSKAASARN